jgi:hypothetical protein
MSNDNDNSVHDSQISQAYGGLDGPTTPADLDDRILSAARREVGEVTRKANFSQRWAIPVSVAAVLVLSVSLISLQYFRKPAEESVVPQPAGVATSRSAPISKEQQTGGSTKKQLAPPQYQDRTTGLSGQPVDNVLQEKKAAPAIHMEESQAPAQRQDTAEPRSADLEIEHIRQLLKEGHQKEATTALESFHQQYPDYPLEPEMIRLLDRGNTNK